MLQTGTVMILFALVADRTNHTWIGRLEEIFQNFFSGIHIYLRSFSGDYVF